MARSSVRLATPATRQRRNRDEVPDLRRNSWFFLQFANNNTCDWSIV
jgi:hypothetical protein